MPHKIRPVIELVGNILDLNAMAFINFALVFIAQRGLLLCNYAENICLGLFIVVQVPSYTVG